MRLYLVRHTKVDLEQGTCYGQTDVGLNSSFQNEANVIVEKLRKVEFSCCYTSPLSRCVRLSEELKQQLKLNDFKKDDRLLELNFGEWEGMKWDEIEQLEQAKNWFGDWVNIPTPNGESYLQLVNRVHDFLQSVKNEACNNNVLIVTHGGVVRAFNAIISNIDLSKAFDLEVDYGEILEFEL